MAAEWATLPAGYVLAADGRRAVRRDAAQPDSPGSPGSGDSRPSPSLRMSEADLQAVVTDAADLFGCAGITKPIHGAHDRAGPI